MNSWIAKSLEDLSRSDEARLKKNEGRSRVCARRAAGWAASAFLEENHYTNLKNSSFQNIGELARFKKEDIRLVELCENLSASLEKKSPEDDSQLPGDFDLLADARELIAILFPNFNEQAN